EVEPFGMGSVIVRAVPVGMSETFAKDFLRSAFDECRIGSSAYDLATKACKAAIKGGDSLEMYDIQELTRKLFSLDDPFNCPHGRPIVIKLTRREIDKLFKRIL
ncbi:MAG: DNA mismatch repair protein MutL, partial [Bacillota bacterium]|nr:DNA mismatch repair protein MutL [Bacillota bacterium]